MGQFLLVSGILPLTLVVVAALVWSGQGVRLRGFVAQRLPLLAGLGFVFGYGSAHATVHMMFGYRLLLPYLPVLIVLVLNLVALADDASESTRRVTRKLVPVLVLFLLVFQAAQARVVYARSLGGIGISGEFNSMSLSTYSTRYLSVMEAGCRDLERHIQNVPRFRTRAPRFLTFAEGYIPYCLDTLYVYGHIVSYRVNVNPGWPIDERFHRSADYVYVLHPRHGSIADQLRFSVDTYEVISSHTIEYDGRDETFAIYYNPAPESAQLPPHVR